MANIVQGLYANALNWHIWYLSVFFSPLVKTMARYMYVFRLTTRFVNGAIIPPILEADEASPRPILLNDKANVFSEDKHLFVTSVRQMSNLMPD